MVHIILRHKLHHAVIIMVEITRYEELFHHFVGGLYPSASRILL